MKPKAGRPLLGILQHDNGVGLSHALSADLLGKRKLMLPSEEPWAGVGGQCEEPGVPRTRDG